MNELQVIGKENVAGYEFTGIEGGFGDGTRGMLVRDIAKIHRTSTMRINELINRNKKRFKDGVDLINLKQDEFVIVLNDNGFTQNSINRSKYIYLLSERGYSKLLKILEDDTAWDIYDKFVDGYFNMRKQAQRPMTTQEQVSLALKGWQEHDKRFMAVENEIEDIKDNMGLPANMAETLMVARRKQVTTILGGKNSIAYKKLSKNVFAEFGRDFKQYFELPRYDALAMKRFNEGLDYTHHWQPSINMSLRIRELNAQIAMEA
ncbi:ORF6C domain-containing protein [Periweissella fabaria]|uniref:Antirepressor n=1 Tax=Periweissella fabaria TaxID=546157 RepID=A0ABN8BH80_9LACO|nr:ORF6C domain-containing protein [Periweissella fabaria]MCM0596310.1 ORF6C domain-containing protein [Periweissella fabaria]CAH0415934.1 hypothetical protein WFA24289_00232 [Periweissella fabaria]